MKRSLSKSVQIVCILIVLGCPGVLFAQKGITGLVNAEKGFASFTASHTIREGFLKYMDSTGVVFQRAAPVNALRIYQQQKPGPAVLNWTPEFAVVSASGDMGITTGPYEYRSNANDTVAGRGSFSSVWQMNAGGEWKNMVDLGTSYNIIPEYVGAIKEVILSEEQPESSTYEELLALEQKLNSLIHKKNLVVLQQFFPEDSRLNRDRYIPVTGTAAVVNSLEDFGRTAVLMPLAGNISPSKDLAWFYGSVISGSRKENYLRVWILRKGKWSVIFQTIKA